MMYRACLALAAGLILAGCATPYVQETSTNGGYSESRRGENVYIVRFQGNAYTPRSFVEDMALLRAAELTLQKGFPRFAILDESAATDRSTVVTPVQTFTNGSVGPYGQFRANTVSVGGTPVEMKTHNATLRITLLSADVADPGALDARQVVDELKPRYKR